MVVRENENRRSACFIVCAPRGDQRAARGVIGRAIRKVIGARRARGCYMSAAEIAGYSDKPVRECEGRYTPDVTDEEFQKICDEAQRIAAAEGWTQAPMDGYHD